jgi:hypothetical protein
MYSLPKVSSSRGVYFPLRFNFGIWAKWKFQICLVSFVAAGLGVALLPEQIKRLPHEGVIFLPLRRRMSAGAWAIWKDNNSSGCLKQYIQIVKGLS